MAREVLRTREKVSLAANLVSLFVFYAVIFIVDRYKNDRKWSISPWFFAFEITGVFASSSYGMKAFQNNLPLANNFYFVFLIRVVWPGICVAVNYKYDNIEATIVCFAITTSTFCECLPLTFSIKSYVYGFVACHVLALLTLPIWTFNIGHNFTAFRRRCLTRNQHTPSADD
ncbi:hypothetical protein DdX_14565 [Ditylenchus destructor]|uniref:Uncharacterized protein n=1 Tax=Ditylenchus destructor TaxID=166010 RepID=A0AAD4QYH2_9BILA|nr:hypothetical protein DdX_14565 [Ditylenchus destructor]